MKKNASKPWWQSRIIWLNAAFAALTVVEANLQLLQASLGASAYTVIAGLVAAGNVVLRAITTTELKR